MKFFAGFLLLTLLTTACNAQYYYKDIISTKENTLQWRLFRDNRVRSVRLNSLDGNGQPTEGFVCDQEVTADFTRITTHTKSVGTTESWIITAYSPQGLTVSTSDTSDTYRSTSEYHYDNQGRLLSIVNTSIETDNHLKDVEEHIWQYRDNSDKPAGMLRIKNNSDTTYVRLVLDEKGNIAEEHATRNNTSLPEIYYYYDDNGRLTDIVRYNEKAHRLLPDNVFEYGDNGRTTSRLDIHEGGLDYQKWLYQYSEKGLKTKESCYNRQRQLLGTIEYQYTYK